DAALARELAALAGGGADLARRAQQLADAGDHRLACHLIELATTAEPESAALHATRAAIYQARRERETSLMAKGIYGAAASESLAKAGIEDPHGSR
ncbi:MAG: MBL fold metallo-hydrolase, partial [Deltaproteobacteria bacterium]|nr:MBL fold metallo-hydrolase [Deltaproteobacteria bacterium]